jgi:penicillin-binding protein 1A
MAGRKVPKRRRSRGGSGWRSFTIALGVVAAGAILGLAAVTVVVALVESRLPDVPTFEEYARAVPKVSRVLAADGTVIAEFFTERRTLMSPDRIPPLVENAILAAEDADFRTHEGLSYGGIARAMMVNLWKGRVAQGGSTLTQQVVKQVLLGPERTWQRKFKELLLARRLEASRSKDEILAMYLTEVYLGAGRYGFEEAARFWFGKRAVDLDLGEAALLAGLVSAPEANSPLKNPEGALGRRRYVLRRMVELGYAKVDDAERAAAAPVRLWAREDSRLGAAPYFVDAVRREVTRLFGVGRLLHDGLTVGTTLDLATSDAAEAAVALGLSRLWANGRTREADEAAATREDALTDGSDDEGLPEAPHAVEARVVRCDRALGRIEVEAAGERALLDPASLARVGVAGHPDPYAVCAKGAGDLRVSKAPGTTPDGAAAGETRVNAEPGPQAAMAVLDPQTRAVLALVGGESFEARPFNRAIQSRRPMGSTVKPFLYAAALNSGLSANTAVANTAVSFRGGRGRSWTPRNYEGGYDGREYGLAEALAKSVNVVAVKVLSQVGVALVADLLTAVGVDGGIPSDLSLALGSAEVSPLALANAMSVFAANGLHDTPYLVSDVVDADGKSLLAHRSRPSRILPQWIAKWVRGALREAVVSGTAKAAANLPVPAWGKTGTSNRSREAWFAGSDGRRVVTILVGYDDRLPMHGATGGNTAVPFFVDFVKLGAVE